jgi:hypothetical protein
MRPIGPLLFLLMTANVTAQLPNWVDLADRARWAANAHNVQSWLLEPVAGRPDQKRLVLDPSRLLPATDPFHRQLTISLGAFLAVLEDEAARRGARVSWTTLSDGSPGALITLSAGSPGDRPPVVDGLTAPTVKYKSAAWSRPAATLAVDESRSTTSVRFRWFLDPAEVQAALAWARQAYRIEMNLPRTRDESMAYTVYGEGARKAKPYGITLLPNFPQDELFWVETFSAWFPQSPQDYARTAIDLFDRALVPVSQVLVVTSQGNGVREQLLTGEALQRLWQKVRSEGGELLPLSQGLQEFPEMARPYAEASQRWAQKGETVQMVLALFRPQPGTFLPSPRIPAAALVR